MLPIDLRPEEQVLETFLTIHTQESTEVLYTTRVGELDSNDLQLFLDSMEYVLNKFNEAIDYIKTKQNNL